MPESVGAHPHSPWSAREKNINDDIFKFPGKKQISFFSLNLSAQASLMHNPPNPDPPYKFPTFLFCAKAMCNLFSFLVMVMCRVNITLLEYIEHIYRILRHWSAPYKHNDYKPLKGYKSSKSWIIPLVYLLNSARINFFNVLCILLDHKISVVLLN